MDEKQVMEQEELNKSLDALIDDLFAEEGEQVEKSIDIAHDAKTTADAAVNQAPKAQDDDKRGAGRPKQVSDVPAVDEDGRRASEYDASTTENEGKEDEPEETEQSPSMDQTQDKKRIAGKPAAPKMAPFKKSETGDEISQEEWEQFQAFKKSQEDNKKAEELKKAEDLKKAEKQEQETLIKSAVAQAVSGLKDENAELKKSLNETQELLKAMASQPQRSKSITGIEAMEKSEDPLSKEPESFSKSEMLDAAEALVKSGHLTVEQVIELENTGSILDPNARKAIEKKLQG